MAINYCQSDLQELTGLDQTIHAPARLVTMMLLSQANTLDFTELMSYTELTWGNLSTHLSKLEDAGYVMITKTFKGKRPRTLISLTEAGRQAYLQWGRSILKAIPGQTAQQIPLRQQDYDREWNPLQPDQVRGELPPQTARDIFFLPRYHRWGMELPPLKEFQPLA